VKEASELALSLATVTDPHCRSFGKTPKVFDLSVSGDQFFLYCLDADDIPNFITGFSYNGPWMDAEDIQAMDPVPLDQSALPEDLLEFGSVFVPHAANHVYVGALAGDRTSLLSEYMNSSSYEAIATPNECSSLKGGDAMVFLVNSDEPDQVIFFPLVDIPDTVGSLYLTDNAYLGDKLATNEATIEVCTTTFFLYLFFADYNLYIFIDLTHVPVVATLTFSPTTVQHS
jgi:hypothetical protein